MWVDKCYFIEDIKAEGSRGDVEFLGVQGTNRAKSPIKDPILDKSSVG